MGRAVIIFTGGFVIHTLFAASVINEDWLDNSPYSEVILSVLYFFVEIAPLSFLLFSLTQRDLFYFLDIDSASAARIVDAR